MAIRKPFSFGSPCAFPFGCDPTGIRAKWRKKSIERIDEAIGSNAIDHELTSFLLLDQASLIEHGQVLGDRGDGHIELGRDLPTVTGPLTRW
jgi:hypothetical protein